MWCLVNFKVIKDALSGLMSQVSTYLPLLCIECDPADLVQAQVTLHVCNQSLTRQSRLHALDIQDIGALIANCSMDSHATSQLITLKDDKAQSMLDLLQTVRPTHFRHCCS
jgi:hypothetical protein